MIRKLSKSSYFTITEKSNTVRHRLDKINIFEYFGLLKKRNHAKKEDILLKELYEYFCSNLFKEEFSSIINNDIMRHKFFLLHVFLLGNRVSNAIKQETNTSILTKLNNNILSFHLNRPIFTYSPEFMNYYISREFKLDNSPGSIVIEHELIKILSKEQVKSSKLNLNFLKILSNYNTLKMNKSESNDENKELIDKETLNFENKILKNYLFVNRDNLAHFYNEKLLLYFSAHYNYLSTLNIQNLLNNRIYWGLKDDLLLNGKV
jgi:hypothetical protein